MIRQMFSPAGRIGRGTYWLLSLIPLAYFLIAFTIMVAPTIGNREASVSGLGSVLFLVGLPLAVWFNFCTICKRYHDLGKSGWWYCFMFIPLIGPIWQFIECGFVAGDEGDNEYGPPAGSRRLADIDAQAAPGLLASKQIDFSKYRTAGNPLSTAARTATNAAAAGKPVFGKRA